MSDSPDLSDHRLVILFGPGRSGTSSVAGTLARMGVDVPKPEVPPNNSNPRGFYEPQWVVDFHKDILGRANVSTLDVAPDAPEVAEKAAREGDAPDRLREWLAGALTESRQIIIKDPRTVLLSQLWIDAATDLGVEPGFLTMMRHPAEVSGSRTMHYAKSDDADRRRALAVRQIAGWVNIALISERVTRGHRRVTVRYPDLLEDWRRQADRIGSALDLRLDPPTSLAQHPVDEFLDAGLRRSQVDWSSLEVPDTLEAIGESLWEAYAGLIETDEADDASFDALAARYASVHAASVALATDHFRRVRKPRRNHAQGARRKTAQTSEPQRRRGPLSAIRGLRKG
ncbi:hypothetical protein CLV56_2394 [Mumia flava]|uniref:Sulfotransferase family protein n=1 Tax=Mumia flava TaxID=1348852 RepID=A0A0B2BV45_9ACTN|nr:sulfotransferase family protein [Mumia flava]PJJ58149.1 hypothetical protein CLV56_2394 [Mumia flava]